MLIGYNCRCTVSTWILISVYPQTLILSTKTSLHPDRAVREALAERVYRVTRQLRIRDNATKRTVVQSTDNAKAYVFRDIENVAIEHGMITDDKKVDIPEPINGDTYTIAQLYRFVKGLSRDDGGKVNSFSANRR